MIAARGKRAAEKKVDEKDKKKKKKKVQRAIGAHLKAYNLCFFLSAFAVAFMSAVTPLGDYGSGFRHAHIALAALLVWGFPISRANEIIYAFLRDAIDKVNGKESSSNLSYGERIGLALRSYLELVVNFATVYYLMPAHWFDKPLETFPQALYFSGVTITTLGYGDFAPECWIAQFVSVYEVFCGFSLLIVSFTVYVSFGASAKRGR